MESVISVYVGIGIIKRKIKDLRKVNSQQLHQLFDDMRKGVLPTKNGTPYKSTGDYIKIFKTFWHWYQRIMKKKGQIVEDITIDLDRRGEKPKFIYFHSNAVLTAFINAKCTNYCVKER